MIATTAIGAGGERLPAFTGYHLDQLRRENIEYTVVTHLAANGGSLRIPGIADCDDLNMLAFNVSAITWFDGTTPDDAYGVMQGLQLAYLLEIPKRPEGELPGLPLARWHNSETDDFADWARATFDFLVAEDSQVLTEFDSWHNAINSGYDRTAALLLGFAIGKALLREDRLNNSESALLQQEEDATVTEFNLVTAALAAERRQAYSRFERIMNRQVGSDTIARMERDKYAAMVARVLVMTGVSDPDTQTTELDQMLNTADAVPAPRPKRKRHSK